MPSPNDMFGNRRMIMPSPNDVFGNRKMTCDICGVWYSGNQPHVCRPIDRAMAHSEAKYGHGCPDLGEDAILDPGAKAHSPAGEHYRTGGPVEPIDLIESLKLGWHEGNIVKYVSRWQRKGGKEDLLKARWYLDRLIGRVE